jgi:glycine cleavage system H protein
MTVILMLTMFVVFLTIDYFMRKGKVTATEVEAEKAGVQVAHRMLPTIVAGFELPENRRYHQGHTWALQESPTLVRVGIDDFGVRLAGKIDGVTLPKRGQWLRQGQKFATLHRDGQSVDLISPVEGEVTNVNEALATNARLSNEDPYGEGWFVSVIAPDLQVSFRNLLNGSLARKWMEEAASQLRTRVPALAGAVAQDGGLAMHDLTAQLPTETWGQITKEFFLT